MIAGTIKLWAPPVAGEESEAADDDVSSRLTLSEYFARAYLPRLEQRVRPGTITIYRETLAWWAKLSGDPPIAGITQDTIDAFRAELLDARFRRGKAGQWRPLSAWSRVKIMRTLRAVLGQLGPQRDDLLRRVPRVEVRLPDDAEAADTWSLERAREILAHAAEARLPTLSDVAPGVWWRAFLALAAYTGLRRGTLLQLRRRHLVQREDGPWLVVDAASCSKVRRTTRAALHRLAVEAIAALPPGEPDSLLLPWPHHIRTIGDIHYRIQSAAGIPAEQQHELHGWRRWHANRLVELGLDVRLESARAALGHSSLAITQGHYLTQHLVLARALPDLW